MVRADTSGWYNAWGRSLTSHWIYHRMGNISHESLRENQNTYFMFKTFYRKLCRLWDNVEKYGTDRQATDDNMHALCVLDTSGYKHTLRICNTYCFFHCNNGCTKRTHCYFILTLSFFLLLVTRRTLWPIQRHSVHLWIFPRDKDDLSMKLATYPIIVMTCYLIKYNEGFTFYLCVKPGFVRDVWVPLQAVNFFKIFRPVTGPVYDHEGAWSKCWLFPEKFFGS